MIDIEHIRQNVLIYLEGNKNFRSDKCVELLRQADIVVTNPPFNLFREYVKQLFDFDKKFLIIGNPNTITHKEIFPLIMENKMWTGYTSWSGVLWFVSSSENNFDKIVDGKKLKNSAAIWFTNLDVRKLTKEFLLGTGGEILTMKNKFNIKNQIELARVEEKISKQNAIKLWNSEDFKKMPAGTFETLAEIHKALFAEIYDFAGKLRGVNISKGNFRFASTLYLREAVLTVEKMPQKNFDEIVEKYIEMNVAHPFREGNGRSMRIWLDHIFKNALKKVVDWSNVDKNLYLQAMERSPIDDAKIKKILAAALTDKIDDREIFMKGLDASYFYENYFAYRSEDL